MSNSLPNWPSPEEIAALRKSMLRMIPACEQVSESFYSQLFSNHPELRSMFPESMSEQQEKLVMMLARSIDLLDRPDHFAQSCEALGRQHVDFGAADAHYPVVTELTLTELARAADPPLSDLEASSWRKLLALISEAMLRGAHQKDRAPDPA